ncbi:MAG: ABC transporter permease [Candidatus Saganbacteria bacterium]|nr:ABC transporter permease [Candidatus Saganbacteria bacterium]
MLAKVNDLVGAFLDEVGAVTMLARATILNIARGKTNYTLTIDQMVKMGVNSLPIALIGAGFVGMVFAVQISTEFVKFGAGKFVGGVMAISVAREFAPALSGIIISARVASAITAEMGTMKVTEQIDALKALGSNPVNYLVIPRFWACMMMMPLLTILADVVCFFGGYLVAVYLIKINSVDYMSSAQQFLSLWDVFGGVIKSLVFGMVIAIIASHKGLITRGGAKGVGEATTSSVVASLIALFIINYFLSVLFFK